MQQRIFDSIPDARLFASDLVLAGYRQAAPGEAIGPGTFRAKRTGAVVTVCFAEPRQASTKNGKPEKKLAKEQEKVLREAREAYIQEADRLRLRLRHVERETVRIDAFLAEKADQGKEPA